MSATVKSIMPFVPARDFELSTRFYKDLGFTCASEDQGVRCFRLGAHGFLLQDYFVEDWAGNSMLDLHVDDAAAMWQQVVASGVLERYEGVRGGEPKLEDWGMIVGHLVDPSGVLWHITQRAPA